MQKSQDRVIADAGRGGKLRIIQQGVDGSTHNASRDGYTELQWSGWITIRIGTANKPDARAFGAADKEVS